MMLQSDGENFDDKLSRTRTTLPSRDKRTDRQTPCDSNSNRHVASRG